MDRRFPASLVLYKREGFSRDLAFIKKVEAYLTHKKYTKYSMKKFLSLMLVLAFAFSFTSIALAQTAPTQGIGTAPLGGTNIGETGGIADTTDLVTKIMDLVNWVAWFVGLVAVLMGLYAGILFITAGGNAESVTKARNILLYAIVGIAVAIMSFSLVAISKAIFGF